MTSAAAASVQKYVGEVRPPGFMKYCAMIKSELAETPVEDGSSCSGTHGTASAADTAVAKPAGEARPPVIAESCACATRKSELAVSSFEESGGAGPSGSRAHGTTSAEVTAVVKSAGEAWPPGFAKYSATSDSESNIAESSDEESSDEVGTKEVMTDAGA